MSIFIIVFFIMNLNDNIGLKKILYNDTNDTYMDFYNSLIGKNNPYDKQLIYPPLASTFYYFLSIFIPEKDFELGSFGIRSTQYGRFLGGLYITLTTLLFIYSLFKLKNGNLEEKILLALLLILSGPFLFQLERANLIFVTLSFIMFYVYGYNSQNKYIKNLAFISLAIASSFKIYPAVLGFLLVKEKRYRDAWILFFYGITFFVLPIIFVGGFEKFPLFINNIVNATKILNSTSSLIKLSINNLFHVLSSLFKIGFIEKLGFPATILTLISGILIIILSDFKEKWKPIAIGTTLMITVPNFSFIYAMIFISIPLVLFLDEPQKDKLDNIYIILFVLMLVPLRSSKSGYIESISIYIMMILLWLEGSKSIYFKYISKNKKSSD